MSEDLPSVALPPRALPAVYADLEAALRDLAGFRFAADPPPSTSSIPGGRFVHQLVEKAVHRQIDAVVQQSQAHAAEVHRALALLTEIVVQQLDDLQDGLAGLHRAVNELQAARDGL